MIDYSPCKINLGLNIINKREDGFHNLETLFFPIHQKPDIIELQPSDADSFSSSGIIVDCPDSQNLCIRSLALLRSGGYDVPSTSIHLHKQIPFGAGLGGGSADATTVMSMANRLYGLGIAPSKMETLAAMLGSDTSYFVRGGAQMAVSRGEILAPLEGFSLSGYYIYIVMPPIHISTAQAFSAVRPAQPESSIRDIVMGGDVRSWRGRLVNDFEASLRESHPMIATIKQQFYDLGALYASLSGSGAAVYGIFDREIECEIDHLWHVERVL